MAIFRAILFAGTWFAVPPGLWLYPNLFEDVGFFDSFRPVWGWQKDKKKKKSKTGTTGDAPAADGKTSSKPGKSKSGKAKTAATPAPATKKQDLKSRVEEVEED
ncbi:MAG: hypothetical protein Q9170_008285 [Blastenia crenularia]